MIRRFAGRRAIPGLLFCLMVVLIAAACDRKPPRASGRTVAPQALLVYTPGVAVEGLGLEDTERTSHSIEACRGRLVVLEFWSTRCPIVRKTEPARRRLAERTQDDVRYFAVESNRDESPGEVRDYLREHASSYTVLMDYENMAARRFNATRTPLAFVLDREGVVRFAGPPISPQELARSEPQRLDWLEDALEALLAARRPDPPTRPVHGTQIRRVPGN